MVHSTYRFALLTFNLLCSIEAMKESFVGGDSVVDAYGAEDKGQKLQVSLGEHDTGHGETEDEANGEDVAFVEVTASGALTTIARPRNSSLVEAVQADEAELAGEAEQDEDAEEADEVDGAKLTGEAEKAKEAENDQPGPRDGLFAAAQAAHPMPKNCFDCISQTNHIFCKDSGKAVVSAMGNTIVYTVNPDRCRTELYDLKVLTVVTDSSTHSEVPEDMLCSIGEGTSLRKGTAGHVTLTYPSGGQLITSTGHWIELTRIDTSLDAILRVAGHEFGEEEVSKMRQDYNSKRTAAEQEECVQMHAREMIQKSMPSKMKYRTKF